MHLANPRIINRRFSRPILYGGFGLVLTILFANTVYSALFDNGCDLSDPLIPADEVHHGGPPRDGIPALIAPKMIPASEAGFLNDEDRVLGLEAGGEARAYPLRILSWHELVNDTVGGSPILVSW